jgi:hypothetical protein
MSSVRNAAVAGQFYPAEAAQLQCDVDALLAKARRAAPQSHNVPKVLVVPHAGYVYSGAVAAAAYASLDRGKAELTRVVLLGPSHRLGFAGIATSSAAAYRTPLGEVPLDREAIAAIGALPGVHTRDEAHAPEHSLEVHLPFLQRCLHSFSLVPLVVGDAVPERVADVIEALWGGSETLIVISSDLSHFLSYAEACDKDARTARRIEARETSLGGDEACGCRPLNGLLTVLRRRGLSIQRIAMNNSGDTAGDRRRVVGYGAWRVDENKAAKNAADPDAESETLSLAQRQQLLHLARSAISQGFSGDGEINVPLADFDAGLKARRGSFVTLNQRGQLRGCIGSLAASRPLLVDVAHNARAAAFRDPRFKPLTATEYASIDVHISVLSPARPVQVRSRRELIDFLQPGVHGLILQQGKHRATYLPSVWEKIADSDRFIAELRAKAGLPRGGWSDELQVSVYTTEEFC